MTNSFNTLEDLLSNSDVYNFIGTVSMINTIPGIVDVPLPTHTARHSTNIINVLYFVTR